jgi:serine/threonine protein kinase
MTRARLTQVFDLLLLAPDIQEEILFAGAVDDIEPLAERDLRPIVEGPGGDRARSHVDLSSINSQQVQVRLWRDRLDEPGTSTIVARAMPLGRDEDWTVDGRVGRTEEPACRSEPTLRSAATTPVDLDVPVTSSDAALRDDRDATRTADRSIHASSCPSIPAPLRERDAKRYEIVGEHGRGGLGRVFRARDTELGREVAIKELLRPEDWTAKVRFFREAIITSRLEHPGIVPVHEAGCWPDGTPFYSMKLVSGTPLSKLIERTGTWEHRVSLVSHVAAVADAIAYAHSKRIIHRDLKPANVIIGAFGETVVIDWGLAKPLDDDTETVQPAMPAAPPHDLTMTGTVLGTPAYMAPEQTRGEPLDERADIFALGRILSHVVTGEIGLPESSGRATAGTPIPRELESIIRQATRSDRRSRYLTAADFAADLRRFLAGDLVAAHSYRRRDLARRWLGSHSAVIGIALVAFIAIAVVAAIGVVRLSTARDEIASQRNVAEARATELEQERDLSNHRSQALVLGQARRLVKDDPAAALQLLADNLDIVHEARDLVALIAEAAHGGLPDHVFATKAPAIAALSPDGNLLAIHDAGALTVHDVATGEVVRRWETPIAASIFRNIDWLDAQRVASIASGGVVNVFDIGSGDTAAISKRCGQAQLAVDSDTRTLATICDDGAAVVAWVEGESLRTRDIYIARATSVAAGFAKAFVGDAEGIVHVFAGPELARHSQMRMSGTRLTAIAPSATTDHVLIGTADGVLSEADLVHRAITSQVDVGGGAPVYWIEAAGPHTAVAVARDHVAIADLARKAVVMQHPGGSFRVLGDYVVIADTGLLHVTALDGTWSGDVGAHSTTAEWIAVAGDHLVTVDDDDGTARLWSRFPMPDRRIRVDGNTTDLIDTNVANGVAFASDHGDVGYCESPSRCSRMPGRHAPRGLLKSNQDGTLIAYAGVGTKSLETWSRVTGEHHQVSLPARFNDVQLDGSRVAVAMTRRLIWVIEGGVVRAELEAPVSCENVFELWWLSSDALAVNCSSHDLNTVAWATGQWKTTPVTLDTGIFTTAPLRGSATAIGTRYGAGWFVAGDQPAAAFFCVLTNGAFEMPADRSVAFMPCDEGVLSIDAEGAIARLPTAVAGVVGAIEPMSTPNMVAISSSKGAMFWDVATDVLWSVPLDVGVEATVFGGGSDYVFVTSMPGAIEAWRKDKLRAVPLKQSSAVDWMVSYVSKAGLNRTKITVSDI